MNNRKLYDQWIGTLNGLESMLDLGILERMSLNQEEVVRDQETCLWIYETITLSDSLTRSAFMDDHGNEWLRQG